jgi:hypothetical protein
MPQALRRARRTNRFVVPVFLLVSVVGRVCHHSPLAAWHTLQLQLVFLDLALQRADADSQ